MRHVRVTVAMLVTLAVLPAVASGQALGTYDGFASPLDPTKWRGAESIHANTLGVRDTEITRVVAGGQFRAALRTFGASGVDAGVSGSSRNRLNVAHPNLIDHDPRITVLQVKVTPKDAVAEDCAANDADTRARSLVSGHFFNDGTGNVTTGDQTGDIIAGVSIERHSKLGDRIVAFIARCDQSQCADAQTLKSVTFDRAWTINAALSVRVRWRPAAKQFEFLVGGEAQVLPYGDILLFDTELPKTFFFPIGVQNTVANCTGPRLEAFFDALFDNVSINATAISALQP